MDNYRKPAGNKQTHTANNKSKAAKNVSRPLLRIEVENRILKVVLEQDGKTW